jgi:sigma-B regulation protein RsbU (phosphoserine phosphatase)
VSAGDSPSFDYGDAFALIGEMARGFAAGRDFATTLAQALSSIASHVRAEAGSLWILDEVAQELVCMACVGPNPITGMRLSATEGIVGKSVRENVCQTIFDVSQSPDFSHKMDDASGLVTRSILCAPMSFSDQVVGALELINKQTSEGHFSEADAEVLQVLASSAGLAISNQRLLEPTARRRSGRERAPAPGAGGRHRDPDGHAPQAAPVQPRPRSLLDPRHAATRS